MAQPALNVFHALDQALAAAVAAAVAPSVVHVSRGHGGGTRNRLVRGSRRHLQLPHPRPHDGGHSATPDGNLDDARRRGHRPRSRHRRRAAARGRRRAHACEAARASDGRLRRSAKRSRSRLALARRPGRTARASLRAIGVLGPEVETPHGGTLDRYVESDRQIPRGFAGGPLIDADGAVIGMNTRTLVRGADLAVPTVDAAPRGRRAAGSTAAIRAATSASAHIRSAGRARSSRASRTVARLRPQACSSATSSSRSTATPSAAPTRCAACSASRPGKPVKLALVRGGAGQEVEVTLGRRSVSGDVGRRYAPPSDAELLDAYSRAVIGVVEKAGPGRRQPRGRLATRPAPAPARASSSRPTAT